jgi:hypothetical protein
MISSYNSSLLYLQKDIRPTAQQSIKYSTQPTTETKNAITFFYLHNKTFYFNCLNYLVLISTTVKSLYDNTVTTYAQTTPHAK